MMLREYQKKIVEKALRKNTLVVLPTGLGKTIIAIAVAKERLKFGSILMMAPTRPLVEQHKKTFREWGLEGEVVTGRVNPLKRKRIWESHEIFFATPQTVWNDIREGRLSLSEYSLLVFDEAHRAVGDYAYVFIAKNYINTSKNPLILALTASPGNSKEKILEVCRNLYIEEIEFRTERSPDVLPYVKKKTYRVIMVDLPAEMNIVRREIIEIMKEKFEVLKERGLLENSDPSKVRISDLIELQGKTGNFFLEVHIAQAIKLYHLLKVFESYGTRESLDFLRRLREERKRSNLILLKDARIIKIERSIRELLNKGIIHPKLNKLVEILREKGNKKSIIFVNMKKTAEFLEDFLNNVGFKARKFVGQREGMSQKEQIKTIESFREGEFDILISTSIGEEGLHIPNVDSVIFYEPVPSALRSIQRKGRTGRTKAGEVMIMVTRRTMDSGYYFVSRRKEREMTRNLIEVKRILREERKGQKNLFDFFRKRF